MTNKLETAVTAASAWLCGEIEADPGWLHHLDDTDVAELETHMTGQDA